MFVSFMLMHNNHDNKSPENGKKKRVLTVIVFYANEYFQIRTDESPLRLLNGWSVCRLDGRVGPSIDQTGTTTCSYIPEAATCIKCAVT